MLRPYYYIVLRIAKSVLNLPAVLKSFNAVLFMWLLSLLLKPNKAASLKCNRRSMNLVATMISRLLIKALQFQHLILQLWNMSKLKGSTPHYAHNIC